MADLDVCRVCLVHASNEKLLGIFENGGKLAIEIFIISGVNFVELTASDVPALICENCIKELKLALKFRNRVKTSDKGFFRSSTAEAEISSWEDKLSELKEEEEVDIESMEDETNDVANSSLIKCEAFDYVDPAIILQSHFTYDNAEIIGNYDEAVDMEGEKDANIPASDFEMQQPVAKKFKPGPASSKDQGNFQCKYCFKSFRQKTKLNQHITKVHQDVPELSETRKFICKICGMKFQWKNSMVKHMRRTHGELQASSSKTKFNSSKSLKEKQEKLHQQRATVTSSSSSSGLTSNSPEKPKCQFCQKPFSLQKSLNYHLKMVHGHGVTEKFSCKICDKEFSIRIALNRHEKEVHGEEYSGEVVEEILTVKFGET